MPKPLKFGDCEACKLHGADNGPISWKGPIDAPVVVLGQSPGRNEVLYGAPFVGDSGLMVSDVLTRTGFDPSNILYYNSCQCAPGKDDDIGLGVLKCCQPNVDAVLKYAPRKLVIALGNEAWASLHHRTKIGGARTGCGRIARVDHLSTEEHTCWGVWGVHPAFIMRSPSWKPEFEMAFERAYRIYSIGEPERPPAVIYPLPRTADEALDMLSDAAYGGECVVDIETNNVISKVSRPNYQTDDILGVGLAWKVDNKPHAAYIPISHGDHPAQPCWSAADWARIHRGFSQFIFNGRTHIVTQNGKFDARFLRYQYNFDMRVDYDTMIAHRIIDENKPHSLKFMARYWINCPDWDIIDRLPDGGRVGTFPIEEVAEYCCWDCVYTMLLKDLFVEEIEGQPYKETLHKLEFPAFNELTNIELRGMAVDFDVLDKADEIIIDEMQTAIQDVDAKSGWAGKPLPHNDKRSKKTGELLKSGRIGVLPTSDKDVGFVLYDHFKCPFPTRKKLLMKDGRPRTNQETIEWMFSQIAEKGGKEAVENHPATPFIDAMSRYRSLSTLYGNVIKGTRECVYPDGKLHTNYGFNPSRDDLSSPVTGRLSSSGPNMQNWKAAFRPIIVSAPGKIFIEADYSQLEVRVWAHHCRDKNLLDAILSGDYHRRTASAALGKPEDQITKEERAMSKVLTFGGVMYGGDTSVVCRKLRCSEKEARNLLDGIFAEFSDGKAWLDAQVQHAKDFGWVETLMHRRRRIPEINSSNEKQVAAASRQALNSPIQGGAADITNLAIINMASRFIEELDGQAYIVNTVHDSIIVECPVEMEDAVKEIMQQTMTAKPIPDFAAPLDIEFKSWHRWGGEPNYNEMRMVEDDE